MGLGGLGEKGGALPCLHTIITRSNGGWRRELVEHVTVQSGGGAGTLGFGAC